MGGTIEKGAHVGRLSRIVPRYYHTRYPHVKSCRGELGRVTLVGNSTAHNIQRLML